MPSSPTDRTQMADVVERLLALAEAQPDHLAVVEAERSLTYRQFVQRAARMAAAVARAGEHPRVLVHLPQGADAYAAMFGTAMGGGYYVPMNIEAPLVKQRSIRQQFAPDIVIGTAQSAAMLETDVPVIDVAALPEETLEAPRPAHDLIYVIFTSGSTGQPKGVALSRAGLDHYVAWALEAMQVSPSDRWSQQPNIAFDLSVLDIYGALCGGATLYPLTGAADKLMPAQAIVRHKLTIWNSVPSVVDLMRRARQVTPSHLASLRLMTFCGEALLPQHLEAIFAARPELLVHNTYGPTEATVSMTLIRLTEADYRAATRATVAIGDAIPGMGLHLVEGDTPDEGEIVITGPQLARGYWGNPTATEQAFCQIDLDGRRQLAYRTGDWGERRDGQVYFKSRRDFQVKINGYRIDLDEVNGALRQCGFAAAQSALVDGVLTAFLEIPDDVVPAEDALRKRLETLVEPYAVPVRYVAVPAFPRNANDKVDLNALIAGHRSTGPTPP